MLSVIIEVFCCQTNVAPEVNQEYAGFKLSTLGPAYNESSYNKHPTIISIKIIDNKKVLLRERKSIPPAT